MARATFEGPVIAGDNRFGPLRNIGYVELVQDAYIDLSVTTPGTNGYSGTSGQYAYANGIPNIQGQLYTLLLPQRPQRTQVRRSIVE